MIVIKNIAGSFIGTLIAIYSARWIGWLPSYDCVAEQYFVEHYKEIAICLLAAFFTLGLVCALFLLAKAIYLAMRSVG